jgi:hypothetical protein
MASLLPARSRIHSDHAGAQPLHVSGRLPSLAGHLKHPVDSSGDDKSGFLAD